MGNAESKPHWHRYKDAISSSAKLVHEDRYDEALKLLDDAIAEAIAERQTGWICTLSHHGAVLSDCTGNLQMVKNYYRKSLEYDPENARALYGLADAARQEGEVEIAREYAARCYRAIVERENEIARVGLLDLVIKHWPEVARK